MNRPLQIRILGAGVAGLTASIALAERGHRIELIDEHFAVPKIGTVLGIFGSAQTVLARLGVLETIREVASTPRSGTIYGRTGQALASLPAGDAMLVARSDLVRILQDALPEQVQRRRDRVSDVRPLRIDADLVVGADGVHSLMRRSGWPGRTAARTQAMTVLRGTTPLAPPEVSETWGEGWLMGITPLAGAEGTNWFACVPEHRTGSVRADLEHLREVLGGARPALDEVLASAQPENTLVHGLHTAPAVLPVRENVVLLGDAAHAMAPNLGHGANTALEDADALARMLERAGSRAGSGRATDPSSVVRSALRAYALHRTLPGQAWRLGSDAMLRMAMASTHADLRDRLLERLAGLGRLSPASSPGS